MSEYETAAPVENVQRGSLFALLSIPAAIVLFAIVGGLFSMISGIIAIAIPFIAAFLYTKGAGAPLSRAGWLPFILISAVAVVLGTFTSVVAATFNGFLSVGGDGGLFGSAFLTTLGRTFNRLDDIIFPILIGLGAGLLGIVSVIRNKNQAKTAVAPAAEPWATDQQPVTPVANWQSPQPVAPVADQTAVPPVAAPTPAPRAQANQPSPGVMLNGKLIDPNKK